MKQLRQKQNQTGFKQSDCARRWDRKMGLLVSKISQGAVSLLVHAKRAYDPLQVRAIPSKVGRGLQKGIYRIRHPRVRDKRDLLRLRDYVVGAWDRISSYLRSHGSRSPFSGVPSAGMAGIKAFARRMSASLRGVGASITRTGSKARRKLRSILKDLARRFTDTCQKVGKQFARRPFKKDRRGGRDIERVFKARAYPGSRDRKYIIHVPPGYTGKKSVPLVMMLHGCGQSHKEIQAVSAFDALADRTGFLVVYPFLSTGGRYLGMGNGNCWGWWLSSEIQSGSGEVEDLWQIIEEIRTEYCVDPRRIHVTGLSAGAGMTVAMLVAHASQIASGATVAGVPYSETMRAVKMLPLIPPRYKSVPSIVSAMRAELGNEAQPLPIFIVHSHDDETVDIMAARNLRDSWAQCLGIDLSGKGQVREGSLNSTHWEHARYWGEDRRPMIETLFLKGPGHGWYGGKPGKHSYPEAPNISELIWYFFDRHPLPA